MISEFLRIATRSTISDQLLATPPTLLFVDHLLHSAQVVILRQTYLQLKELKGALRGLPEPAPNVFHNTSVPALMRERNVGEILTADKRFRRFNESSVRDPVLLPIEEQRIALPIRPR